MHRVLAAARLHLANPWICLGVPWLVVGSSFAINLLVFGFTAAGDEPGTGATGGLAALYVTVGVVCVQAVTQLMPFAMGVGLSRRTFFLGTSLFALAETLAFAVALTALDAVENATGGWGMGLDFWAPGRMDVGNPALQFLAYAGPMLACAVLGLGAGVVFKRWGALGMYGLAVTVSALTGGGVVLLSALHAWDDLWRWLGDASMSVLALGIPVATALVVGAFAFAGMRRVVP